MWAFDSGGTVYLCVPDLQVSKFNAKPAGLMLWVTPLTHTSIGIIGWKGVQASLAKTLLCYQVEGYRR